MLEVKQDVWKRYLWSSKSYSARIGQKLFKEELWNSEYLHVRSQERCTGRDTCEFPRATVPESGSNFIRRNCESQSTFMWEVSNAVWERYLCSSCRIFLKFLLKLLKKWCTFDAVLKLHQKCIKNLWNYFKSASNWSSFKSASKLHQKFIKSASSFLDISTYFPDFSEIAQKLWYTFDAVLMQCWCSLETTSKVHQNPMKLHQKCIKLM